VKNILFVKIGALGDLSFALPAAQAIKSTVPCTITWIVGRSYAAILRDHAFIDKLVVVNDKNLYSKNWLLRIYEILKLSLKLHRRFDQVIIAHRDAAYYYFFNLFSRGPAIQLVRDKNRDPAKFVYVEPMSLHESLAIKKLVAHALKRTDVKWEWDYSHIAPTTKTLPEKFAVLHLGGGVNAKTEFKLKCWPHWEALVLRLLAETDLNLVFVGSPAEEMNFQVIAKKIAELFPQKMARCFNLMKDLSITEMIDVIRRGDLFVGVDSGPLHIADSMGKKCIGLFGPTSTLSWGLLSPQGKTLQHAVPCAPCYKDLGVFPECFNEHKCMELLSPDLVYEQIALFTRIPSCAS
jgi:ADP-heptose:LPS heptosyltransferase